MSPIIALTATDAVGIALIAAVLLLVILAAFRLARRRGPPEPPSAVAPSGPQKVEPEAGRPPETTTRGAVAGKSAEALRQAPEEELDREALEARKKEAYRQKKEAEQRERERRRIAREAEEEQAREEARRVAREEAEARLRAQEEERKKVQAEAGKTLADGLAKTRGGFVARISSLLGGARPIDEAVLAELEEVLFTADIGVRTATRLLESARDKVRRQELKDGAKLRALLKEDVARILSFDGKAAPAITVGALSIGEARPWVVMVVGVNGSGKTTTIGKLAWKLRAAGHSVLLGAGDTFRAGAGEQLEVWAKRVEVPLVRGKEGADPASVCFEAVQRGAADNLDVVVCDTAGRLHTKAPLMEELKKVKRVIGKAVSGAPHEVLLVLDATNGQNAIAQARQFHEALGITGIVLTKLDGTAKGGVVIGICDELGLPVRYVGVGEKVADLQPFSPAEFVEALFA